MDAGFTHSSGSSGGNYLDGYGQIASGLPNPYKSRPGFDPRGSLASSLGDPMAVLAQAQEAVRSSTPPIPDWKSVYNEAVSLRQQRLEQELAAIQEQGTRVASTVHGLVGQPLSPGDGPLGRDFQNIWAQTGKFAEAQVPMMQVQAERGARSKASEILDAIMGNLTGTSYQGSVQQAVNQPGHVLSALGSFTSLANDRAAAARSELDSLTQQRVNENQAAHAGDLAQFNKGADFQMEGLKAGFDWNKLLTQEQGQNVRADLQARTSRDVAGIGADATVSSGNQRAAIDRYVADIRARTDVVTNANTVGGQIATNDNTVQGGIEQANIQNAGTLANTEAQARLKEEAAIAAIPRSLNKFEQELAIKQKDPQYQANLERTKAQMKLDLARAKNVPIERLSAGERSAIDNKASAMNQAELALSNYQPVAVEKILKSTPDANDLAVSNDYVLSMAYRSLKPGGGIAPDVAQKAIQRLASAWGYSQTSTKGRTKAEIDRVASGIARGSYDVMWKNYNDWSGQTPGQNWSPAEKKQLIALYEKRIGAAPKPVAKK